MHYVNSINVSNSCSLYSYGLENIACHLSLLQGICKCHLFVHPVQELLHGLEKDSFNSANKMCPAVQDNINTNYKKGKSVILYSFPIFGHSELILQAKGYMGFNFSKSVENPIVSLTCSDERTTATPFYPLCKNRKFCLSCKVPGSETKTSHL